MKESVESFAAKFALVSLFMITTICFATVTQLFNRVSLIFVTPANKFLRLHKVY